MADKRVLDLDYADNVGNDDSFVADVNSTVRRVKLSVLKSFVSQWENIVNKPFDSVNSEYFSISNDTLGLSESFLNNIHSHDNKANLDKIGENGQGKLTYNGVVVSSESSVEWNNVLNKPFSVLSEDFTVSSNTLSVNTALKSQLHSHQNMAVLNKLADDGSGNLIYDGQPISGGGGLDFMALADAMTTGTLTGLSITANTEDENFDIIVTGIPTIAIDSNNYWTIDGVSTGVKATGEDGATPTIDGTTKHWIIDGTDTQVVAEGQNGFSPYIILTQQTNGVLVQVINSDGTQEATVRNGTTSVVTSKLDLQCTALASGWSNSVPYTQTIAVSGLTSDINPMIDVVVSSNVVTGLLETEQFGYITKGETSLDTLTLYCYKNKPTIDLNIMIEVV